MGKVAGLKRQTSKLKDQNDFWTKLTYVNYIFAKNEKMDLLDDFVQSLFLFSSFLVGVHKIWHCETAGGMQIT